MTSKRSHKDHLLFTGKIKLGTDLDCEFGAFCSMFAWMSNCCSPSVSKSGALLVQLVSGGGS